MSRRSKRFVGGVATGLTVAVGGVALIWYATALNAHANQEGHPVTVERVKGVKSDVAEIKKDVKSILALLLENRK